MTQYHATMVDECGDEFGVTLDIDEGVENVTEYFREMYPESRVLFVENAHGGRQPKRAHYDYIWEQRWTNDEQDLY